LDAIGVPQRMPPSPSRAAASLWIYAKNFVFYLPEVGNVFIQRLYYSFERPFFAKNAN